MSERLFECNYKEENGDIVAMHAWQVPESSSYPEGVVYSFVYIRNGKRLVGYDNENHGTGTSNHHRHIGDRIVPYKFVDLWTLFETFSEDLEKIRRGTIK